MSFISDPAPVGEGEGRGGDFSHLPTSVPKPSVLFSLPRIGLLNKYTRLNLFYFFLKVSLLWRKLGHE